MDYSENILSDFDSEAAEELYQLLQDLILTGTSDICIDPRSLLSLEADNITAINRSAALEKEAQDILRVFTNAPVTPVFRGMNSDERALVPINNANFLKCASFKIDIWKNNNLASTIENYRGAGSPMFFINIKIDQTGSFTITGTENLADEVKETIRELGGLMAMEDMEKLRAEEEADTVIIKEITNSRPQIIEVPLHEGYLKFTANQDPLDVLSEIYRPEQTSDNKKIFKVPDLGDFVVSPEDDSIEVFKAITGYDLTEFYKNSTPENTETPQNDYIENEENKKKIRNTKKHGNKKNKKRKSKKRK